MGLGGISIWQLLIILLIIVLLFGTKRLKSIGSDIGDAIKGFRKSMGDDKPGDEKDGGKSLEDKAGTEPVEKSSQKTEQK